eukprot:Hpha_TRINITY_DN11752_c0_g1::TRINITY_DN11752_c0_g1_i1::g.31783::m.31783
MSGGPSVMLGKYKVWHGSEFQPKEIAKLYMQTARRGNPVLGNATDDALLQRGEQMAIHCADFPGYWVLTEQSGRPVGVYFTWDLKDPPNFTLHPSMGAQTAMFEAVDQASEARLARFTKGKAIYSAYVGLLPGTPSYLVPALIDLNTYTCLAAGYTHSFGLAVHPAFLRLTNLPADRSWVVHYGQIEPTHASPTVGPGRCICVLTPLLWTLENPPHGSAQHRELCPLPTDVVETLRELREPCDADTPAVSYTLQWRARQQANQLAVLAGVKAKL